VLSYLLVPQFLFGFFILHVSCTVSCIGVPRLLGIRWRLIPFCGSVCANCCLILCWVCFTDQVTFTVGGVYILIGAVVGVYL
jgi:hypothetical protein